MGPGGRQWQRKVVRRIIRNPPIRNHRKSRNARQISVGVGNANHCGIRIVHLAACAFRTVRHRNGVAIVLSASYNFLMNRNVTFKSSSNFGRSVALFMLLWVWNYLFGSIMLAWLPSVFGWNAVLVKFLTMACQFAWGYPLCKEVIFR